MASVSAQQIGVANRSVFAKVNDLEQRGWVYRLSRFLRAQLRTLCVRGELLADDPRVVRAWAKGWETSHFLRFLRWRDQGFHPQVIYDIGAHDGLWSEMCEVLFAPHKCLLFEPQRQCHEKIHVRRQELGVDWILWPVALGDSDGTTDMHLTQNLAASSLLKPIQEQGLTGQDVKSVALEEVQVKTLDGLVGANNLPVPDLVKIDVQGFEWRVLTGGKATFPKAQRMVIEVSLSGIYEQQPLLREILNLLSGWGFELEDISETLRTWPEGRLWQVDLWLKQFE